MEPQRHEKPHQKRCGNPTASPSLIAPSRLDAFVASATSSSTSSYTVRPAEGSVDWRFMDLVLEYLLSPATAAAAAAGGSGLWPSAAAAASPFPSSPVSVSASPAKPEAHISSTTVEEMVASSQETSLPSVIALPTPEVTKEARQEEKSDRHSALAEKCIDTKESVGKSSIALDGSDVRATQPTIDQKCDGVNGCADNRCKDSASSVTISAKNGPDIEKVLSNYLLLQPESKQHLLEILKQLATAKVDEACFRRMIETVTKRADNIEKPCVPGGRSYGEIRRSSPIAGAGRTGGDRSPRRVGFVRVVGATPKALQLLHVSDHAVEGVSLLDRVPPFCDAAGGNDFESSDDIFVNPQDSDEWDELSVVASSEGCVQPESGSLQNTLLQKVTASFIEDSSEALAVYCHGGDNASAASGKKKKRKRRKNKAKKSHVGDETVGLSGSDSYGVEYVQLEAARGIKQTFVYREYDPFSDTLEVFQISGAPQVPLQDPEEQGVCEGMTVEQDLGEQVEKCDESGFTETSNELSESAHGTDLADVGNEEIASLDTTYLSPTKGCSTPEILLDKEFKFRNACYVDTKVATWDELKCLVSEVFPHDSELKKAFENKSQDSFELWKFIVKYGKMYKDFVSEVLEMVNELKKGLHEAMDMHREKTSKILESHKKEMCIVVEKAHRAEDKISLLENELDRYQEVLDDQKVKIFGQDEELEKLRKDQVTKDKKIKEFDNVKKALVVEKNKAREDVKRLTNEVRELKIELQKEKKNNDTLMGKVKRETEKNELLDYTVRDLENQLYDEKSELERLSCENKALLEKMASLKDKLDAQNAALSSRKATGVSLDTLTTLTRERLAAVDKHEQRSKLSHQQLQKGFFGVHAQPPRLTPCFDKTKAPHISESDSGSGSSSCSSSYVLLTGPPDLSSAASSVVGCGRKSPISSLNSTVGSPKESPVPVSSAGGQSLLSKTLFSNDSCSAFSHIFNDYSREHLVGLNDGRIGLSYLETLDLASVGNDDPSIMSGINGHGAGLNSLSPPKATFSKTIRKGEPHRFNGVLQSHQSYQPLGSNGVTSQPAHVNGTWPSSTSLHAQQQNRLTEAFSYHELDAPSAFGCWKGPFSTSDSGTYSISTRSLPTETLSESTTGSTLFNISPSTLGNLPNGLLTGSVLPSMLPASQCSVPPPGLGTVCPRGNTTNGLNLGEPYVDDNCKSKLKLPPNSDSDQVEPNHYRQHSSCTLVPGLAFTQPSIVGKSKQPTFDTLCNPLTGNAERCVVGDRKRSVRRSLDFSEFQ